MNMRFLKLFTLVLLAAAMPAALADEAGSVVFAKGDVTAERAPPVPLAKGDAVLSDDTVATGDNSRAQLLMLDGAKIAIRPNSRLAIEEYSYTDPAAGASVTAKDDKSVMSLVKGGFRTITGAIGRDDPEDYEVRTPVGVLGIRGTDYTAVFCNGDCDWVPGLAAGASIPDGLYLGVTDGIVVFRTATRTIELRAGEYAFIPLNTPEPERLPSAPPVLLDDNDLRFDPGADNVSRPPDDPGQRPDDDDATTGFNSKLGTRRAPATGDGSEPSSAPPPGDSGEGETPAQPTIGTDPSGEPVDLTPGVTPDPPQPQRGTASIAYGTGPLGALNVPFTGSTDNEPAELMIDANGDVTGFVYNFLARAGGDTAIFDIDTAANVDLGNDALTMMRWGRWAGNNMIITTVSDGNMTGIDLGAQSLHWIKAPDFGVPAMPIAGNANYTLIGSTMPTDNQGNVGVLIDAGFQADFTNMTVNSSLDVDIGGSNWSASGNGNIGAQAGLAAHLFNGLYNSIVINGIPLNNPVGSFSGFFSEPGPSSDPNFPGGVGLTFELQDGTGIVVSGAAAFGDP